MANVKRGDVVSIDHDTHYVTMVNKETRETFVAPIEAMTRPEIMSAYAFLFPGSGRLLSHTTEEMREALLLSRPITPRFDGIDDAPTPVPSPTHTEDDDSFNIEDDEDLKEIELQEHLAMMPEEPRDAQEFLGRRKDGSFGDPFEHLVRVIARDEASKIVVPGDIDEDKVRAIARQEAAKTAPRITRLELPDREPRQIEGKVHPVMRKVLAIISQKAHVYLSGPAGTGKSMIAEQVAELLGLEFSSISCHPQMTGAALFGYPLPTGGYVPTEFRKRFEHGGVFCIDEMDNGNPAIISSLNQALSNRVCAFPDGMVKRNDEFIVVGTGNTFGTGPNALHMTRQALDTASRTRFFGIEVPEDPEIERAVIDSSGIDEETATDWHNVIHDLRRAVNTLEMRVSVSMRHAMIGAKALAAGLTRDEALEGTVFFGVPVEQVAKIREESGVR